MRNGIKNSDFDRQAFYKDGIKFKSIGSESDNLINTLAELYGVKNEKGFSNKPISFTSFALLKFCTISNPTVV